MIYTITPNPCLDLGGTVNKLVPDEKSYVHDEIRAPGGNSINAARIIKRLGVPVTAMGFLGGGVGLEIQTHLDHEKVSHEFIQIKGRTRINVTVSNAQDHRQTRLSFPGPRILPSEREALFNYISKIAARSSRESSGYSSGPPSGLPSGPPSDLTLDHLPLLLVGGSLPPGFTETHLVKILRLAEAHEIPTIVDVPGHLLKCAFASSSTLLIKPNLTEFQALTGTKASSLKAVLKLAKKFTHQIPLICVSSVEGGALLVTPHASWFGRIPRIKVKSTVGAGDSMVGAMSAYLWKEGRKEARKEARKKGRKENRKEGRTENHESNHESIHKSIHKSIHNSNHKNNHQNTPQRTRSPLDALAHSPAPELPEELLRHGLAAACGTLSLAGMLMTTEKEIKQYLRQIELQRLE